MATTARKPLISGNWKMHHNHFEAISTIQKLSYLLDKKDPEQVDVSVHPPFTDLRSVQTVIEADDVAVFLGAQHCHYEEKGAFTGEVSPAFLAKLNVSYVITGHSERRELFGETDEVVNTKAKAILQWGMTPIVCCGETLAGINAEAVAGLVVAYEPIWAIGTGKTASADDAQNVCALVRATVADVAGADAAAAVRIQYGGSVKPDNAVELMAQPDIDGALVGGASLVAEDFAAIVQYHARRA